MNILERKTER
jgi:hypothetical protein